MRRGIPRRGQKAVGSVRLLPTSYAPNDLVRDLISRRLPVKELRRGCDKIFDKLIDQPRRNGACRMKVHMQVRSMEEREGTEIIVHDFRQFRIDQQDDLSRVQRATDSITECVEHAQFPDACLQMPTLGLQEACLLAKSLIGFLQSA